MYWALIILSAVFVGMGKGGLPVVAVLGVPTLSLIMSPTAAAGMLLPVYIVSDLFALRAYRRDFDSKVLKIGILGMTVGVAVGGLIAQFVIEWMVTFLIGVMGFCFAMDQLKKQNKNNVGRVQKISYKKGYFWCTVSGFTSFVSHTGGPPWQIFTLPLGMSKSVFVGTSVIAFSYCNLIKLIPYLWLGQINTVSIKTSLVMIIPATFAVYFGVSVVKLIPEKIFYKIVTWALLAISFKLIVDGIRVPVGF